MKIAKKILLSLLAIPLVLLAFAVAVQTYYHFTPVALSAEAIALSARAAKLPTLTENGYRLYGLFAPREQDPVVFGKCLTDAYEQHRREVNQAGVKMPSHDDMPAWAAYEKGVADRSKALDDTCLKGGTRLTLPKALTDIRANLATTEDQWKTLAAVVPDETVLSRADAVRNDGVRRLGAEVDSPFVSYESLMKLERWRIARGVIAWRSDDRQEATNLWTTAIADWSNSANSNLIEAMLAAAAQTQVLIAMQTGVAQSARIDGATADALLAAIKPIESMPEAIANSMLAEWQMQWNMMKQVSKLFSFAATVATERNAFERAMDRVGAWTLDFNGTMNELAKSNLWTQDALRKVAHGQAQPEYPAEMFAFGCTSDMDWGIACTPFMRNSTGQILSAIAMPSFVSYGTRIADLRNLAAATRLTIAVRRRPLAGDALAQFVANAPGDMRDVFTGRPFVYDSARKRLSVELRERSTILGDKGPYELQL